MQEGVTSVWKETIHSAPLDWSLVAGIFPQSGIWYTNYYLTNLIQMFSLIL